MCVCVFLLMQAPAHKCVGMQVCVCTCVSYSKMSDNRDNVEEGPCCEKLIKKLIL